MRGKRIRLLADQGELDLLREIRLRAGRCERGGAVRLGIGDDCALLRVRDGEELAVTTDLSIAGRHFRMDWHPPESVGHRTLARGLSDLAAMGARPVAAFLSLGVPRDPTIHKGRRGSWVERFFSGMFRLARCPGEAGGGQGCSAALRCQSRAPRGAAGRGHRRGGP